MKHNFSYAFTVGAISFFNKTYTFFTQEFKIHISSYTWSANKIVTIDTALGLGFFQDKSL